VSVPVVAHIGLGSNLDDPPVQILRALDALIHLPATRLLAASSLYGNPPMGPQDQPDYVNAAAALETRLSAQALLAELHAVERAHGRVRNGEHWGPRTLDLDLITYGLAVIDEPGLVVPHPGASVRAFVLLPLAEITPDLLIPGHGPVRELLDGIDTSGLVRLAHGASQPRISLHR
jgi:2-amino-4-hydroxy-6-hydroxymethyldihydropteridine diphosphokinase